MATVALPLPAPAPGGAEREIAAAIAGHRAARREILARADASRRSEAAVQRQLEDALAGLRRLEAEFARFRASARAEIDAARCENLRVSSENATLSAEIARLRAGVPPMPEKPFERELSVSRLRASADAPRPATVPKRRMSSRSARSGTPPRPKSSAPSADRGVEPLWIRRTFSRIRSAQNVTAAERDASAPDGPPDEDTGRLRMGRSFSRSFSSRSSRTSRASRASTGDTSRRARTGSGKWTACF